jgi:hypothetical protein
VQQDERRQNAQNNLDFREGEFGTCLCRGEGSATSADGDSDVDRRRVRHNLKLEVQRGSVLVPALANGPAAVHERLPLALEWREVAHWQRLDGLGGLDGRGGCH